MDSFAALGTAMADERSAMLSRIDAALQCDERVVAAWVAGSFGRGDADDLSDLDVHLAIADDQCAALNAQRRDFVSSFGEPVLVQEAPQNAPEGGAFLLVLYRGISAPIEVDWSWAPASKTAIHEHAVVLFDRSAGLPRRPEWVTQSPEDIARQISLSTTFFWAMAFITAKKIARGHTTGAFDLLRMMQRACDRVRNRLAGQREPMWGSIGAPHETLPPTEPADQIHYLSRLVADMASLQPTTDGAGGLVTEEAGLALRRFVELIGRRWPSPNNHVN